MASFFVLHAKRNIDIHHEQLALPAIGSLAQRINQLIDISRSRHYLPVL